MDKPTIKKQDDAKGQTIGRQNARELTPEEVALVSGGLRSVAPTHGSAGTCISGGYDDICY
jgi:hypothetical protein